MRRLRAIAVWVRLVAAPRSVGSVDASGIGPAQAVGPGAAQAIRALIDGDRHPLLGSLTPNDRQQLTALYAPRADAPMWVDLAGRPNCDARAALTLLNGAGARPRPGQFRRRTKNWRNG
jgi:hypothetical protein